MPARSSYEQVKVPFAVTLGIKAFTGPTITEFSSFLKNMVVESSGPEPETPMFVRHRPAFITTVANDYAHFGYQIVNVGGAKTGASATGLANNSTVYTASIAVDGAANAIAVTGSTAQTYTNLVAQINNDLTGAVAEIFQGNIRVYSESSGTSSTIAITDTNLFSTLTNFSEVSDAVAGIASGGIAAGRGVYYWESTDALYFINDDTLFTEGYTYVSTISSGHQKCYFGEVGTSLFITDPENNEAWLLSASDVLTKVTDADFPATLADGLVVLNGRAYVLDDVGQLYGSDADNASSWNALNFIEAERSPDGGIFVGAHHDDIAVFGPRTLEFFYDAGNPTGSVLSRRQDVFYNVGAISGESIVQVGDTIYFLGTEAKGSLALYRLDNYQLQKVSSFSASAYLTNLIFRQQKGVYLSAYQAQGKTYVLINPYDTANSSYSDTYYTFAYDTDTSMLYWFTSNLTGIGVTNGLQITDWTLRTGPSLALGRGITADGVIVSILDTLSATDSGLGAYVATGYWASGYAEGDGETGVTEMPTRIRTGFTDHGTTAYKYPRWLEIAGDYTNDDALIQIAWSKTDSQDSSYGTPRQLNLRRKNKLTRLGRFVRISYDITYTGEEPVRLAALELPIGLGGR